MKLTDNLGRFISNSFLVGIVLIGLLLTYAGVKAKEVADNWQKTNDQAVQMADSIK